jgi:hypothetical protein
MTDFLGYGREKRREGNLKILAGDLTFRWVVFASYSIYLNVPQRWVP